jgi:hypothetical protein
MSLIAQAAYMAIKLKKVVDKVKEMVHCSHIF